MLRAFGWLFLCLSVGVSANPPSTCTYSTYKWSVVQKKAVDFRTVSHPYAALASYEIDKETGCTVCREDQRAIKVGDLPEVLVCKKLAGTLETQLNALVVREEPILKLVGYRVGMTRGDIDTEGNRTRFSNHSFGIAIDINDEQNGLYGNCMEFGPKCRLRKGGEWDPNIYGSLTVESEIVAAMKSLGLKWGGEIAGKQKDFMHFSPSGY
jgi:hypothetical protein